MVYRIVRFPSGCDTYHYAIAAIDGDAGPIDASCVTGRDIPGIRATLDNMGDALRYPPISLDRVPIGVTTADGLLYVCGVALDAPEADHYARAAGFQYAEQLVRHMEKLPCP